MSRLGARTMSGQQTRYPVLQVCQREGFCYVIVAARLQTKLSAVKASEASDGKDGNISVMRAPLQKSRQLEPIHPRHPHVQKNQPWAGILEFIQGFPRAARSDHVPAAPGEHRSEERRVGKEWRTGDATEHCKA